MNPGEGVRNAKWEGLRLTDERPEFTPWEALRKFEREWGAELSAVTLAGELEVKHADAAEILKTLVRLRDRDPRVLERYPVCVVVSMASCARRVYRGGALWDGLFDLIGRTRQQYLEGQLGNAFVDALEELGKPVPVDSHFRFVAAMALHACVPDYCIDDLLRLLAQRQEVSPGIDGASFVSWATGLGGAARIESLDKPVRDFLTTGDDFAIDLVDRSLDLLTLLRRGERDPDKLTSGSGAPRRFIRWAVDNIDETFNLRPTSGHDSESTQVVLPHITLDLDRWSVLLRLPAVATHGRAWWSVTLDGAARRVQSMPNNGLADSTAPTDMVIDSPTRSVGVALGSSEQRYDLDVVDAAAPSLAFDANGVFIPMGVPLPQADVWLLHPTDPSKFQLQFLGSGRVVSEAVGPVGWNGWSLTQVDVRQAPAIEVNGHRRPVRRNTKASLVASDSLLGVRTSDGSPILSERPTFDVPMSAVDKDWTFEVRDAGTGITIESYVWSIPGVGDDESDVAEVAPFGEWPTPVVGSFEVLARGPLGSRSSWRVNICEGLRPVPSIECRTFVPGGLTPMRVRLDSTSGLHRDPVDLEFGPHDLTSRAQISGAVGSITVEVEPVHLEVCHSHTGGSTDWSSQPLTLSTDSAEPPGWLQVRMPSRRELPPLTLATADGLRQTLVAHKGGARGLHQFDLARLTDTLAAHASGDLGWDFGSDRTTLIRFRPAQIASAVTMHQEILALEDFSGAPEVVGGVYLELAPWRDPIVVPFGRDGRAQCPPELVNAGPLRVELRIDDPWVPAPWDKWPSRGGMRIEQAGSPESVTPAESSVIAYLAGDAPIPSRDGALPLLWSLLELVDAEHQSGFSPTIGRDIATVLRSRPHAAARALSSAEVSKPVVLRNAIRLGILEQELALTAHDVMALWASHPAVAACADSAGQIPADIVVTRCGTSAAELLAGKDDPHARVGRFTDSLRMDNRPPAVIEGWLETAGIVPAGLLDDGTRVLNAQRLFSARKHWSLIDATKYPHGAIDAAIRTISTAGYPRLAEAISTRAEASIHRPWQRLPQMSLLMAGLARVGSRGSGAALRALDEVREPWAAMTKVASAYVEMDIVLAELLVISDDVRRTRQSEEEDVS